jgi:hypothetical protein
MMRTRLIVEGTLATSQTGFTLAIRLPWYRTLPLSVIDLPSITLDGVAVAASDVVLEVNGRKFDAAMLADAVDEWWYVLDRGTLHVSGVALQPGAQHELGVDVHFAPPYILEITLFCGASQTMVVH